MEVRAAPHRRARPCGDREAICRARGIAGEAIWPFFRRDVPPRSLAINADQSPLSTRGS
jgi:hypothetical protein